MRFTLITSVIAMALPFVSAAPIRPGRIECFVPPCPGDILPDFSLPIPILDPTPTPEPVEPYDDFPPTLSVIPSDNNFSILPSPTPIPGLIID
ncbi:hypothetical protein DL96DRAFT_23533 [Flagelloscypha sp. PMI_526]|nr:hypothetical protein DL96DRAFT_23533 [Flagelloscypha sp. PMI_526]